MSPIMTMEGIDTPRQVDAPMCQTVDDFVARVIYDGRFIDTFTTEPRTVAAELGVELGPGVWEAVTGADPTELLPRATEKMTEILLESRAGSWGIAPAGPVAGVGTIIGVGIVVYVAVSIYYIASAETTVEVVDASPDADLKL